MRGRGAVRPTACGRPPATCWPCSTPPARAGRPRPAAPRLSDAHVVGHDWGGIVAWALGAWHPERVRTLTTLSVPHPGGFLRAMATSAQALQSTYVAFFQLPLVPEATL